MQEAFEDADGVVREALKAPVQRLRERFGDCVKDVSLRDLVSEPGRAGLGRWYDTFHTLQWAEIWSCLGSWIETAQPKLGPVTQARFKAVKGLDRRTIEGACRHRERCFRQLRHRLGAADLLCIPTTPSVAPAKGGVSTDQATREYIPRVQSLTAIAGLARLPEISMPLGTVDGVPVGLSLLAGHGQDGFLLGVAQSMAYSGNETYPAWWESYRR